MTVGSFTIRLTTTVLSLLCLFCKYDTVSVNIIIMTLSSLTVARVKNSQNSKFLFVKSSHLIVILLKVLQKSFYLNASPMGFCPQIYN